MNMALMQGETAFPGSLPALFHERRSIYLFLQVEIDKLDTRLQSRSFFSCWDPCVHEE